MLAPLDGAARDGVANCALALRQAPAARLDLDEHDPTEPAVFQPVEHHEVDRRAEKARVAGIAGEAVGVRGPILRDAAAERPSASLVRMLAPLPDPSRPTDPMTEPRPDREGGEHE